MHEIERERERELDKLESIHVCGESEKERESAHYREKNPSSLKTQGH